MNKIPKYRYWCHIKSDEGNRKKNTRTHTQKQTHSDVVKPFVTKKLTENSPISRQVRLVWLYNWTTWKKLLKKTGFKNYSHQKNKNKEIWKKCCCVVLCLQRVRNRKTLSAFYLSAFPSFPVYVGDVRKKKWNYFKKYPLKKGLINQQ